MGRKSKGIQAYLVLTLLLAVEVKPSINPAVVGDTVMLSLSPSTAINSGSWTVGVSQIVTWLGEQQAVFPSHSGRASVNITTGALTLSSVKVSDTGVYTVQGTDPQLTASASITVLEVISNVSLRANETNLMELNSSAVITCSVSSGSSLSYTWMNGSSEVTASDRVQLTEGNTTLTITNVTRYDQGPFRCYVSNLVSNGTSDSVKFTITSQSNPPAQLQWAFKGVLVNTTGPLWKLLSVSKDQSGLYSCMAFNNHTNMNSTITKNILISEPVSSVTLKANKTNLVEFNDTAVLMCSASNGSSPSYSWMNNGMAVTAGGGVQFSNNGATLTIASVTRQFNGTFVCNVSNLISNKVSNPVHLSISYGPSDAKMMIMPTGHIHRTGTNITLSCSAESSPPAMIQWMFEGKSLNHSGPQLQLKMAKTSDSGNYKCVFHNSETSRFSSASKMIRIIDPLTAAMVSIKGEPATLGGMLTLHCEVNGSVTMVKWWKGNQLISTDNSTMINMTEKTLTLNPVKLSDKGEYKCTAGNEVSNVTSSPFPVKVIFGPMKPMIMGRSMALRGQKVSLNCTADSYPPSSYKWFFNNVTLANTSTLMLGPLTGNMSGKYICKAFNSANKKDSSDYTMLSVLDQIRNVSIETPMKPAVEGKSYTLTCNVTGSAHYIYWMKNGQLLHEDNRTTFSTDNKTVTFDPVHYNDTGKYQCVAFDDVLNMTSPPHKLYVNFGPKTPVIKGPSYAEVGQNVYFNCSAKSMPPSHYTWKYNGSKVGNTSVLRTGPVTHNMSGEYTCVAHNNVTQKNSTTSHNLTVIEAIKSVTITKKTLPINSKNFTLTCEVTGPYDSIYWMKDKAPLNNTSTGMTFKDNMLYFTPVTTSDDGLYVCVAKNKATSHHSSPYTLLVNFGPVRVTILGPDSAPVGEIAFMTCLADSRPNSNLQWFYNQLTTPLATGSFLSFSVTNDSSGNYICQAKNPVTNITMRQTKQFTAHAVGLHTQSKAVLMMMGVLALSMNKLFS
ncbi:carcinoembryonic antigen-related cell adhesion molecule 1 [Cheilinus undulatus]|uniref:carcinoembryonic antigen-related cell adhesion molecule 1 n=1 Tax=Cheilinus undulatus TaxID=241271 RepID=UPI001BD59B8B|nr:carcinoembryonic antigen-related cell adhesion molecule 1 [Cheilinus undulatus]